VIIARASAWNKKRISESLACLLGAAVALIRVAARGLAENPAISRDGPSAN